MGMKIVRGSTSFESVISGQKFCGGQRCDSTLSLKISILLYEWVNQLFGWTRLYVGKESDLKERVNFWMAHFLPDKNES